MQYDTDSQVAQESSKGSQKLASDLSTLFAPVLAALDAQLDVRLVRTFLATIAVIIQFRNRPQGLLLSELGAYLLSPQHAPAGTKRISHLLERSKWGSVLIERFLWQRADERLEQLEQQQTQADVASGMAVWWKKRKARKWKGGARFVPVKQNACVSSNQASAISWVGHRSW